MPEKKDQTPAEAPASDVQKPDAPAQEEKKVKLDQTIPGGKYIVNGQLFNANGERIDETGRVLKLQ